MKKLMFAAALATVCGAVQAEPIASDIVGYTHDALTAAQWKPVCAQFMKVGSADGSDMTLGELIPNINDSGTTHWVKADLIKVLAPSGAVDFQAKYYRYSDLTNTQKTGIFAGVDETTFTNGWYKCEKTAAAGITTECLNDYVLPYGSAVLARSTKSAANIQSAGQVYESEDGYIYLGLTAAQWRYIGNCTPVDLTLGQFIPNVEDEGNNHWVKADLIKFLAASGAVDFQAKYYRYSDLTNTQKTGIFAGVTAETFTNGWYKCEKTAAAGITTECLNDTVIKAGSGFLARSTKSAANIKLPSAL